jgi:hypothetical protein
MNCLRSMLFRSNPASILVDTPNINLFAKNK